MCVNILCLKNNCCFYFFHGQCIYIGTFISRNWLAFKIIKFTWHLNLKLAQKWNLNLVKFVIKKDYVFVWILSEISSRLNIYFQKLIIFIYSASSPCYVLFVYTAILNVFPNSYPICILKRFICFLPLWYPPYSSLLFRIPKCLFPYHVWICQSCSYVEPGTKTN